MPGNEEQLCTVALETLPNAQVCTAPCSCRHDRKLVHQYYLHNYSLYTSTVQLCTAALYTVVSTSQLFSLSSYLCASTFFLHNSTHLLSVCSQLYTAALYTVVSPALKGSVKVTVVKRTTTCSSCAVARYCDVLPLAAVALWHAIATFGCVGTERRYYTLPYWKCRLFSGHVRSQYVVGSSANWRCTEDQFIACKINSKWINCDQLWWRIFTSGDL